MTVSHTHWVLSSHSSSFSVNVTQQLIFLSTLCSLFLTLSCPLHGNVLCLWILFSPTGGLKSLRVSFNLCEMEHHPHDDALLRFDCEMTFPPPPPLLLPINSVLSSYWALGKVVEHLGGGVFLERVGHCGGPEVLKPGPSSCPLSVPQTVDGQEPDSLLLLHHISPCCDGMTPPMKKL